MYSSFSRQAIGVGAGSSRATSEAHRRPLPASFGSQYRRAPYYQASNLQNSKTPNASNKSYPVTSTRGLYASTTRSNRPEVVTWKGAEFPATAVTVGHQEPLSQLSQGSYYNRSVPQGLSSVSVASNSQQSASSFKQFGYSSTSTATASTAHKRPPYGQASVGFSASTSSYHGVSTLKGLKGQSSSPHGGTATTADRGTYSGLPVAPKQDTRNRYYQGQPRGYSSNSSDPYASRPGQSRTGNAQTGTTGRVGVPMGGYQWTLPQPAASGHSSAARGAAPPLKSSAGQRSGWSQTMSTKPFKAKPSQWVQHGYKSDPQDHLSASTPGSVSGNSFSSHSHISASSEHSGKAARSTSRSTSASIKSVEVSHPGPTKRNVGGSINRSHDNASKIPLSLDDPRLQSFISTAIAKQIQGQFSQKLGAVNQVGLTTADIELVLQSKKQVEERLEQLQKQQKQGTDRLEMAKSEMLNQGKELLKAQKDLHKSNTKTSKQLKKRVEEIQETKMKIDEQITEVTGMLESAKGMANAVANVSKEAIGLISEASKGAVSKIEVTRDAVMGKVLALLGQNTSTNVRNTQETHHDKETTEIQSVATVSPSRSRKRSLRSAVHSESSTKSKRHKEQAPSSFVLTSKCKNRKPACKKTSSEPPTRTPRKAVNAKVTPMPQQKQLVTPGKTVISDCSSGEDSDGMAISTPSTTKKRVVRKAGASRLFGRTRALPMSDADFNSFLF